LRGLEQSHWRNEKMCYNSLHKDWPKKDW